ncbi:sulfatase-like hydrolase/transferase [Halorussus caseinilyticus]|uniref:Sulfatase-like hydrolase/transferase n=1 Tax=Halorussus caseinilyticus TaxID=3034025 RepID=A0ABD5WS03_9EURY
MEDPTGDGYSTGLFTPNLIVSKSSNLSACFETVERPDDDEGPRQPAQRYARAFLDWQADRDGPWAACLNLMDSHWPYTPEDEYDRWTTPTMLHVANEVYGDPIAPQYAGGRAWGELDTLEAFYDGGIRQSDHAVREIVETLKRRNALDDTLVVVTSDHGEGFGERSRVEPAVRLADHNWGIHECLTHVPLVVRYPGQTESEVVERVVSLTDFPRVVAETVDGTADSSSFVTDGPVFSSTYRLREEDRDQFDADVSDYIGPWRAIYTDGERGVEKRVASRNRGALVTVRDAQNAWTEKRLDPAEIHARLKEREDFPTRRERR